MKKILVVALFATVAMFQAPANAAVSIQTIFGTGVLTPPTGSVENFDGFLGSSAFNGADGGAYSGAGLVVSGSVDAVTAAPYFGNPGQDTTPYLTIAAGNTETITYSITKTLFGLYWGSVDSYNTLDFYLLGNLVGSFTGSDVTPTLQATGLQTDFASNRYVTFAGLFDKVVLGTGQTNAFEIDNIATVSIDREITPGAPELSTWAMMLLGFAGIAFAAYRRRGQLQSVSA